MVFFCENINRLNELRKLLKSNPDIASFYKEPKKIKVSWDDNWYDIALEVNNNKKLDELFDKWYIQDMRNGVLYKSYGGYNKKTKPEWFISKDDYAELVKLGLKVNYPLTHTDALRFLEGKFNYVIYNKDCSSFSPKLYKIFKDRFKSYWDSPDFKNTIEHHFNVSNYVVKKAIELVKE
jgi:hypothetical protein